MFSTRLKELREAAGYKSQQAFADAFGVAQSTVGGWESGAREPSLETLERIATFFSISPAYLVGWEEVSMQHGNRLPCALDATVYIVHRYLTIAPVIEPIPYRKLLAVIDTLPFGHNEAYLTEDEAKAAL